MKNFRILLVASTALLAANFAPAQTWTQTSSLTDYWERVALSADGSKLVAVALGSIFTSTDSGADWTCNYTPGNALKCVACSADGTKLAAAGEWNIRMTSNPIFISMDSGTTWISNTNSAPSVDGDWVSIAISADGNKLVALNSLGGMFISTNSGAAWASTNTSELWKTVACSADGTKLVASADYHPGLGAPGIYTSTDSGNSWTLMDSSLSVSAIASSADGTKLAAIAADSIYVSTDSGNTWNITSAPATNWNSIASSADGSRLVAVAGGGPNIPPQQPPVYTGPIYSSIDSGMTWIPNNAPVRYWGSVVSSSDGGKLVALANDGIWTLQTTPAPQMNITPTNGNLTLSWIVPSTNFVMQQSSDLSSWTDMTDPPGLNLANLQNEMVVSPTNGSSFYRLKTP